MVTIQLVPVVAGAVGWPAAVAMLAVGPLLGSVAMVRLTPLLRGPRLSVPDAPRGSSQRVVGVL